MKVQIEASKLDTDGTWANYSGAQFLIARAGNIRFLNAIDKYERPHRKARARGTLGTDKEIEIQCRSMAEGILLGWKGIETVDGPLEYTAENAYAVLRHNSELREFITEFATDQLNYRTEEIDTTAKK